MSLFSKTEQEKRESSLSKNKTVSNVLGELSGLSLPFKEAEKKDVSRKIIIQTLDEFKTFPVRTLEESVKILQKN